jgi:hypothetical protein
VTYWDSDEPKRGHQNVLRISFHKQIIIATILFSGAYRSELQSYPIELILVDAFLWHNLTNDLGIGNAYV